MFPHPKILHREDGFLIKYRPVSLKRMAPLPLTCGGVECAGVEPGQPERLLGRVEAGARNLGHRGKHQTFIFIINVLTMILVTPASRARWITASRSRLNFLLVRLAPMSTMM